MLPVALCQAMSLSFVLLLFSLVWVCFRVDAQGFLADVHVWLSRYDIFNTKQLEHCKTLKLRHASGPVPDAASPLFIVQQVEDAVQLQVAVKLI